MKKDCHCKTINPKPEAIMSLALSRYKFSTPEVRLLLRQVLGHAPSGRTIKRLARFAGHRLKRGRPLTTPKVHKSDLNDLVELTSNGLEVCSGNTLQFFHQIHLQFGLTPQQYLKWAATFVRRGKYMMRRCLLCSEFFASLDSSERHCRECRNDRRRLLNEERRSSFV